MTLNDLIEMIKNGSSYNDISKAFDSIMLSASIPVKEHMHWSPKWIVDKYKNQEDYDKNIIEETVCVEGNLLLNNGINAIWHLVAGDSVVTPYSTSLAQLGVGDSAVAVTSTQTDLQGTNKVYMPLDASYPMITGQTISFKATFGANDGNWAWNEVSIRNSSTAMINMNRKVQNMGQKTNPSVWSVTLQVTLS